MVIIGTLKIESAVCLIWSFNLVLDASLYFFIYDVNTSVPTLYIPVITGISEHLSPASRCWVIFRKCLSSLHQLSVQEIKYSACLWCKEHKSCVVITWPWMAVSFQGLWEPCHRMAWVRRGLQERLVPAPDVLSGFWAVRLRFISLVSWWGRCHKIFWIKYLEGVTEILITVLCLHHNIFWIWLFLLTFQKILIFCVYFCHLYQQKLKMNVGPSG